ncbi:MAG: hypothetical protein RR296_08950 [Clostridia bacterium]
MSHNFSILTGLRAGYPFPAKNRAPINFLSTGRQIAAQAKMLARRSMAFLAR